VSPNYLAPGTFILPFGTRSGSPQAVDQRNEVYFNVFLPPGAAPPGGWPVVIFGHGSGNSKNALPFNVAASMAFHGLATIAINSVGHGFGPQSTLTVNLAGGGTVTFPAGGRGIANALGNFPADASTSPAPHTLVNDRYAKLQTIVDLIQLVSVIEVGVDVDGDGIEDLDASHVYYAGNSLGAAIGASFAAVDRRVRAAVLTPPGAGTEFVRLSPVSRPGLGQILGSRSPSLLNPEFGLTSIGGILLSGPFFNENLPLRGEAPVINRVPGAMALQELLEHAEWAVHRASAVAFAPYLRKSPLDGVPARPVIVQFSRGDQQIVNPATAAMLRAGDLMDRATLYRHDLFAGRSQFKNPHTFAVVTGTAVMKDIALKAQEQTAVFFASDGQETIDPDGAGPLFEVPVAVSLPELETDLKFVP
jgi:hypothetical protein